MITMDYFNGTALCSVCTEHVQTREIRFDKVLSTRRKLGSGEYNLEEHLDVVVDKLLEEILAPNQRNQAGFVKRNDDKR
jgi:hypothetical protein